MMRRNDQRARSHSALKNVDQAIQDYTAAIRLSPNNAMAYNNRGAAYSLKKDRTRAMIDYQKALKLDPTLTIARDNLKSTGGGR